MIEESLLKSNFVGKDGFVWWIGQVADPSVWRNEKVRLDKGDGAPNKDSWGYRCKVRIIGYHSFDKNELANEDLPWAHVLTSASDGAPGQGGFGKLPMLIGGESVLGFFLDGDEAQQPVVMSCFHRSPMVVNVDNPNPFDAFPGSKGPFATGGATREIRNSEGILKEPPKSTGSGPALQMESNLNFGTDDLSSLDLDPGFIPISSSSTFDLTGSIFEQTPSDLKDTLFFGDKAELLFLKRFEDKEIKGDNGCSDNLISQITATIQNFMKFISQLEATAYGFIDPLRNVVVDVQAKIKKVARLIASVMKFVINGIRDNVYNLIGCLFKVLAVTLPSSIKLPISEAIKNILDIIFCIFEKLFGPISEFIMGLLNGLLGKSNNAPQCAVEETIAALIAKLADMIDGALATVISGLDWLSSGLGSVFGAISKGLDFVSQILSLLDCDGLVCEGAVGWDPFKGVNLPEPDSWQKTLSNIDILGGLDEDIDLAIGFLSMFGSSDTPFKDCRDKITNPIDQGNAPSMPIGIRYYKCIPPEIIINGGGGGGATAQAIVSNIDGSILLIHISNPGSGYDTPPSITILDKTNYGKGALARCTINDRGEVDAIYIVERGSGYCQTNLGLIVNPLPITDPGIGITTIDPGRPGTGIGTTSRPGISTDSIGIIPFPGIIIERPGIGYTDGDTISVGDCLFAPVVTENGSIVSVESSGCPQEFDRTPDLTINTKNGVGAVLYPTLEFLPQFVIDDGGNNAVGIGTTIINVVQCV